MAYHPTDPVTKHVELPTWSAEPRGSLSRTEVEICCGDVREIVEIVGGFRKMGWNRGLRAAVGKLQVQRCTGWDREMVEENGMRWLCDNNELLQVGEGPTRSVGASEEFGIES